MSDLKARAIAADVEGYSRLMHGDEEATMSTLSVRRAVIEDPYRSASRPDHLLS
jgi:hypothetical protein